MAGHKIFGGIHYPHPLSTAQPFGDARTVPWELPVCTRYAKEILSLPMYPEMTPDHVGRVADCIRQFAAASVGAVEAI
jgi:dTDP-4-amino-4,6-dideoxygalactose transaminase